MPSKNLNSLDIPGTRSSQFIDWYKSDDGYTEIGQLVHDLKYRYRGNDSKAYVHKAKNLAGRALIFLETRGTPRPEAVAPVPSFNAWTTINKDGSLKIPYIVGAALADSLGVKFIIPVEKTTAMQSKDGVLPAGAFRATNAEIPRSVLLLDDLFGSGASARMVSQAIKARHPNSDIDFLTLTRNKFGGIGKSVDLEKATQFHRVSKNGAPYFVFSFMDSSEKRYGCVFAESEGYALISQETSKNSMAEFRADAYPPSDGSFWKLKNLKIR